MRLLSLPLLGLLACVPPEQGINRAELHGTVLVRSEWVTEKTADNDEELGAQRLRGLFYEPLVVEGSASALGTDAEGNLTGDVDWYRLETLQDLESSSLRLLAPASPGQGLRLDLLAANDAGRFELVTSVEATAEGEEGLELELTDPLAVGADYRLRVTGFAGDGELDYQLVLQGLHPDEAALKVGAYTSRDLSSRDPVGGAVVRPFEQLEDWSYEATYTVRVVRDVTEAPRGGTSVDEDVGRIYLFAGSWPNLNGALPADTWYSSQPAQLSVGACPCDAVEPRTVEPLVMDALAPLVIGMEVEEVEPNDVAVDLDTSVVDVAGGSPQDLGILTGPGVVDILRGTTPFASAEPSWSHDNDLFAFQVPETVELAFTVDWDDDATDLDVLVVDATGEELLDLGWYNKPETNEFGGLILEPGTTYHFVVLGYEGTPGSVVSWEARLELTAP